jgi:hypothetical protein
VNATRRVPVSDEALVTRISEAPATHRPGPGRHVTRQYRARAYANSPQRFHRVREVRL